MASRDPYAEQYGRANQYNDGPQYNDPYTGNRQPHPTYDQEGYEPYAGAAYRDEPQMENTTFPPNASLKETSEFVISPIEKPLGGLKNYRYQTQGALWTRGGRGRCIGRFCCCTLLIASFLIISIVLALLLWVRPPNITVGAVSAPTSSSSIQVTSGGVNINLGVNISVNNPNYFAVSFNKIQADIFYPINNTDIGGGNATDITFHTHSQTNFTFPFMIAYQKSLDPNNLILVDIATKCGFIGGSRTQIKVNYKITLGLKVLFITVSPVVSNSLSFDCPLSQSDISSLGAGLIGS